MIVPAEAGKARAEVSAVAGRRGYATHEAHSTSRPAARMIPGARVFMTVDVAVSHVIASPPDGGFPVDILLGPIWNSGYTLVYGLFSR